MDNGSYMVTEFGVGWNGKDDAEVCLCNTLEDAIKKKRELELKYYTMLGFPPEGVFRLVKREVTPFWKSITEDDLNLV